MKWCYGRCSKKSTGMCYLLVSMSSVRVFARPTKTSHYYLTPNWRLLWQAVLSCFPPTYMHCANSARTAVPRILLLSTDKGVNATEMWLMLFFIREDIYIYYFSKEISKLNLTETKIVVVLPAAGLVFWRKLRQKRQNESCLHRISLTRLLISCTLGK